MNDNLAMRRWPQMLLLVSMSGVSWLGMMIVHELGHVLGAWLTGGHVARVFLHPLAFSRTDLSSNPHPLCVSWAGPLIGVMLPLLAWGVAAKWRSPGRHILRFFAGFCLIANGDYLAFGVFDRAGDAGDLLRHGAAPWHLWLFGAMALPLGLLIWHRLGPHFGMGTGAAPVKPAAAWICTAVLMVVVVAELAL